MGCSKMELSEVVSIFIIFGIEYDVCLMCPNALPFLSESNFIY